VLIVSGDDVEVVLCLTALTVGHDVVAEDVGVAPGEDITWEKEDGAKIWDDMLRCWRCSGWYVV
jgi:hypothetical protein